VNDEANPDLDAIVTRAMARLRSPASPELDALVDLLLEAALSRPIEGGIDAERVVAVSISVLDADRLERALGELVRPAWERQRALLEKRGDKVQDWLPEGGSALLDDLLTKAQVPKGAWAKKVIDASEVKELLAPVLQETLLAFARKLPMVGGVDEESAAGKAAGRLFGLAKGIAQNAGERAGKLAYLGRGVLGGLGGEMEKRVAGAARDFSHGAFEPLEATFVARLRSDEGQAILLRMRQRAVRTILSASAAELARDLDSLPREALDRLVARAIAFGVSRPELAEMLSAEVSAFVADQAGRDVGEALEAWGLRELAVREARIELLAIAQRATEDVRAETWLRDLLRP